MSRAAISGRIYSWFHKHSSSDVLCRKQQLESDKQCQIRTAAKCQEAALRRWKQKATRRVCPLWLGIKRCLSSLAAARDKAQQTQTGQQHGIGFGFGDRAANGGDLPMVIDPRRLG